MLGRQPAGCSRELAAMVRAHAWLIGLVLAHVVIVSGVAICLGDPNRISLSLYGPVFTLAIPVLGVVFLVGHAAYVMLWCGRTG